MNPRIRYKSTRWKRLRLRRFALADYQCEHVENGIRCRERASVGNHTTPPSEHIREEDFWDIEKVRAVCYRHNRHGTRAEREGRGEWKTISADEKEWDEWLKSEVGEHPFRQPHHREETRG